ncbi:MAG: N-acetylglucosamine-6-phosphate deacetylase [Clostridia bacterium]|nr:N-acetylglucosamine-6-phosphate deacetylase [Clostridia bacterium]
MKKIFKNANINGAVTDIIVEDGKFKAIGKCSEEGIDLKGAEVIPGLVDIHIHGSMNHDTMDGDGLNEISMYLAKQGVTSFLPTTMTVDIEDIKSVVNGEIPKTDGAEIMGYHLEGPYIADSRRGAQNPKHIRKPDIKEFEQFENVKMITVAPEVEGGMEFIKNCNTVVSLGHSDADYETSLEAIRNGAKCLTHTCNAMTPLHHRFPGLVGAAITGNAYAQVICDGVHIHPSMVLMFYRTFGKERMVLISDAVKAAGMPDGIYDLGGLPIKVVNSLATLLDSDVVAGSTSNLMLGVKNAIKFGIPKEDAIYMASKAPATLIGVNKGEIAVGYDADFVVVDGDLNPQMTVVGGRIVEF